MCDGSSFVTSGRGQPTMTIQALAFRAVDGAARLPETDGEAVETTLRANWHGQEKPGDGREEDRARAVHVGDRCAGVAVFIGIVDAFNERFQPGVPDTGGP